MTDGPVEAIEVHTHDRTDFKRCRRLWYFRSTMPGRQGRETTLRISNLWLGTGIHKALERWYGGECDADEGFGVWVNEWLAAHPTWEEWDDKRTLADDEALGMGMLRHYMQYANVTDTFDPLGLEIPFVVPVPDPAGLPMTVRARDFGLDQEGYLPVRYAGRLDGLVRDRETGFVWVLEHKTARGWEPRKLDNDEQITSYLWALRQPSSWAWLHARGVEPDEVKGVLYNVLLKRVPIVPPLLKGGGISRARATLDHATWQSYGQAIAEHGLDPRAYEQELDTLLQAGWTNFFRRKTVPRNAREIAAIGRRIYFEVLDMAQASARGLDGMYPTVDPQRCPDCPFRAPCVAMDAGEDWKEMLHLQYVLRGSSDVDPLAEEVMA